LEAYLERHDLGEVPEDIRDFDRFYRARRGAIADRLRTLLDVEHEPTGVGEVDEEQLPDPEERPALPEAVEDAFLNHLSPEVDGPEALKGRVRDYLNRVRQQYANNEQVDLHTAEGIAESYLHLLDYLGYVDGRYLSLVQAGIQYFVDPDDTAHDFGSGGFDDDAAVLNSLVRFFGREDLVVRVNLALDSSEKSVAE
jgi:uncharacterized membrane protein YkvA (DUF1232 family)